MLQESNEKIYLKCLLTYMICVNIIKHGLFNTIEAMLVVGMCFLVQWLKRKWHKSRFRTFIYLPQRAGILSQRSQRVNSTGKEYCESTGKYSNGRKILWMGSQTHQNLLSSSRVITKQFIVHDLDKYLDMQLTT